MSRILRLASPLLALLPFTRARAEWQRTDTALAWMHDGHVVWKFSFDPRAGKPSFNPLTVAGGPSFLQFTPEDHPWHYGLWFSWKYIDHVNYWEQNRETGKSEGSTRWTVTGIETHADGSAAIHLDLTYTTPAGHLDMTEHRDLTVSAPTADGAYAIDWQAHFTVGDQAVVLDRTPLLGEPNGQVNGGYGGLGVRLAPEPLDFNLVSTEDSITDFDHNRARPSVPAVAANFAENGRQLGGLAVISDPANAGRNAPWYLIHSEKMRFICPAILAPKPIHLAAGAPFHLHYRIALRPTPWTPEDLQAAAHKLFP